MCLKWVEYVRKYVLSNIEFWKNFICEITKDQSYKSKTTFLQYCPQ